MVKGIIKSALFDFSICLLFFILYKKIFCNTFLDATNQTQRSLGNKIECLEDIVRFYRDPNRPVHKIWTSTECSKYYLCLEGEVFNFKCSEGLLFDVVRQICDFKQNVDNCDITAGKSINNTIVDVSDVQGYSICFS